MRSCLEDLIEKLQVSTNPDILAAREKWKLERDMLKLVPLSLFPRFRISSSENVDAFHWNLFFCLIVVESMR